VAGFRNRAGRHCAEVGQDAAIEAFGYALALFVLEKESLVGGIADEGNFGEYGGHVGAGENDEGSTFYAAVGFLAADELKPLGERILNVGGKLAGFGEVLVASDFFDELGKIVKKGVADGVLPRSDLTSFGRSGKADVVSFDAADLAHVARIGVDGDEKVSLRVVGDGGALFERDVSVVGASVDDLRAGNVFPDHASEAESYVETKIFLHKAAGTDGAGVVSAVAGIDGDAVDLEAKFASEGELRNLRLELRELAGRARGGGVVRLAVGKIDDVWRRNAGERAISGR